VQRVPVRRLIIPNEFSALSEVREAVLHDLSDRKRSQFRVKPRH